MLILLLYVDDIIVTSNDKAKLQEVITKLSEEFEMSILGEPKEFLSISIRRDKEMQCIELNQEKYIDKILTRFGFAECHPQRTPMVTTQVNNRERKLREEDENDELSTKTETRQKFPYREAVGSL